MERFHKSVLTSFFAATGCIACQGVENGTELVIGTNRLAATVVAASDKKVAVCHHPPGSELESQTIYVGERAVPAHLKHGDTVGECAPRCSDPGSCDDGNLCTVDACGADGQCEHSPVNCDDGNPCTLDRCDTDLGCVAGPLDGAACNDGNACTDRDSCLGGSCKGSPIPGCCTADSGCSDDNACTQDRCVTGRCQNVPVDCSVSDKCVAGYCDAATGGCATVPVSCNDSNPCTEDSCDPSVGCRAIAVADGASCDDGNDCTTSDVCRAGACAGSSAPTRSISSEFMIASDFEGNSWPEDGPVVGFGAGKFLVVWERAEPGSYSLFGARVSPSGIVDDGAPLRIATASLPVRSPTISFDGTRFLVAYTVAAPTTSGAETNLYAVLVDPTIALVSPQLSLVTGSQMELAHPSAAANIAGKSFVAFERSTGFSRDIVGVLVNPAAGTVFGTPIQVTTSGNASRPAVASDGQGFYVAWQQGPDVAEQIFGAALGSSGFLVGTPRQLSSMGPALRPAIAFGASTYVATWTANASAQGFIEAISVRAADGAVLGPPLELSNPGTAFDDFSSVSYDGSDFGVLYESEPSGGDEAALLASLISASGVSLPSETVLSNLEMRPFGSASDGVSKTLVAYEKSGFLPGVAARLFVRPPLSCR